MHQKSQDEIETRKELKVAYQDVEVYLIGLPTDKF